jgi:hypothetical protein
MGEECVAEFVGMIDLIPAKDLAHGGSFKASRRKRTRKVVDKWEPL